jgi:ParB-like nuclease family protein
VKDLPNPTAPRRSLTHQLKRKSRHRRYDLGRMAGADANPLPLRNDLLPLLAISDVPLRELRPAKRKLRRLDPAHVREVARAIGALGFCQPILVGRGNEIVDGEVRLEAARLLGLNVIPCVRIDHLSPDEQRVLRLAVNRLGEKGEWNLEALRIEFEELILSDAPIEITGFTLDEIDQIVLGDTAQTIEEGPLAPEPYAIAIAVLVTFLRSCAATRPLPRRSAG